MGRVYAVASGKGGVGKTTTTAVLGVTLAAAGESVVVVDADLGMANLAPSLGVDDGYPTLHDVLAGEATVDDAVREATDGLAVVPGSRDIGAFADARPEGLEGVIETLAGEYAHVFVDTGAGLSTDTLAPLRAADVAVLVSTPDRDALRDTAKTAEMCRRLETPVGGLVVTRVDGDTADHVGEFLDYDVLGTVPDDPAVHAALTAATPLPRHDPGSPGATAYRALARRFTDAAIPDPTPPEGTDSGETADADEAVEATADAEAAEDASETADVEELVEEKTDDRDAEAADDASETADVEATANADSEGVEEASDGPDEVRFDHPAGGDDDAEGGDGAAGGDDTDEDHDDGPDGLFSRLFG